MQFEAPVDLLICSVAVVPWPQIPGRSCQRVWRHSHPSTQVSCKQKLFCGCAHAAIYTYVASAEGHVLAVLVVKSFLNA